MPKQQRIIGERTGVGLSVKVLGVHVDSGLNELQFALLHCRQQTANSPRHRDVIHVSALAPNEPLPLTKN
jgi:hypothetical protein